MIRRQRFHLVNEFFSRSEKMKSTFFAIIQNLYLMNSINKNQNNFFFLKFDER